VVKLMDEAADRVEKERDTGLDTQRVQEDVLTRLDRIIKAARQNQQQQQSQSRPQDQDESQNQNQRSQSQQQQANQAAEQANDGPARQDGSLATPAAAAPAAWGDLPAHVRDALLQGFSDKFSSMYKSATESYYRKLAEEKKK
jgi:predicted lipid-binding transport protein (Tim44 family)